MRVVLLVRPPLTDADLNALFAAAWVDHRPVEFGPVLRHSLSWITAQADERLIGFVNVATDGGAHAFVLDTTVHPEWQRHGVGRRLVAAAAEEARATGATWRHVDYEPHLDRFYRACGFRQTAAGLLRLTGSSTVESDRGRATL